MRPVRNKTSILNKDGFVTKGRYKYKDIVIQVYSNYKIYNIIISMFIQIANLIHTLYSVISFQYLIIVLLKAIIKIS